MDCYNKITFWTGFSDVPWFFGDIIDSSPTKGYLLWEVPLIFQFLNYKKVKSAELAPEAKKYLILDFQLQKQDLYSNDFRYYRGYYGLNENHRPKLFRRFWDTSHFPKSLQNHEMTASHDFETRSLKRSKIEISSKARITLFYLTPRWRRWKFPQKSYFDYVIWRVS